MKGRSGPEVVVGFIHSSSSLPTHFKKKKVRARLILLFELHSLAGRIHQRDCGPEKGPPPQWSGSARSRVA